MVVLLLLDCDTVDEGIGMRIVVISDTHLEAPEGLPSHVVSQMDHADLVVHCGDFVGIKILEFLRDRFNLKAVQGNMDSAEVCAELPRQCVVDVGSTRVGIIHGWGAPFRLAQRVLKQLPPVDILLFGHSHVPFQEQIGSTYVFNPGTLSSFALKLKRTYGIIELRDGGIHGTICPA